jgi:hypothetical protein
MKTVDHHRPPVTLTRREAAVSVLSRRVPFLDCHDPVTALETLSEAIDVDPGAILDALSAWDDATLKPDQDPALAMPRDVLASVGVDISSVQLDGVHCFHGSRVLDPDDFRRHGILPLDKVLERLWSQLYELVRDERSPDQWAAFRASVEAGAGDHDGWLYRYKVHEDPGPHAELVRELFIDRPQSFSDFVGSPETVRDIAACYDGADLLSRFRAASVPCIVKFRTTRIWRDPPHAVGCACWYLYARLHDEEIPTILVAPGYVGDRGSIPPEDVLDVEVIPDR